MFILLIFGAKAMYSKAMEDKVQKQQHSVKHVHLGEVGKASSRGLEEGSSPIIFLLLDLSHYKSTFHRNTQIQKKEIHKFLAGKIM